jgi:endoglycosylceramidase
MASDARAIHKVGTWLRDAEGRHVLLRGVNLGGRSKRPPYLPIYPVRRTDLDRAAFTAELASARDALDLLPRLGFNVVRLLVAWKALEPEPLAPGAPLSTAALDYVACLRDLLDALEARGIAAIVDLHQDVAHEAFGGDGFPDWAIPDDAPRGRREPSRMWGTRYATDDGVVRTLRAFWDNDLTNAGAALDHAPVRDMFVRTLGRLAEALRDHPAVLGYEPFNEPHGVGLDAATFEGEEGWEPGKPSRAVLPAFYRAAIAAVRAFDPRALVFVEPRVDWTVYGPHSLHAFPDARVPDSLLALSGTDAPGLVFSFHHYDPWTLGLDAALGLGDSMANKEREWPAAFTAMVGEALQRDLVPFVTEHGADASWSRHGSDIARAAYRDDQARAYVDLQFRQIERNLVSSTYWCFDLYNGVDDGDGWNGEDFSLLGPGRVLRDVDIQCRPFPHRAAACPVLLSFDVDGACFALALLGAPAAASTVIYVPAGVHYPAGFDVRATGARVTWDARAQQLTWEHASSEIAHGLVVTPHGAAAPEWGKVFADLVQRPGEPRVVASFR